MKKYLVFKHIWKGTYTTDDLVKADLLALKNKEIEAIIDLTNGTYFDPEKNSWEEIKKI